MLGALLLAGVWTGIAAETFRCVQANGGTAYQQTPCADAAAPEPPGAGAAGAVTAPLPPGLPRARTALPARPADPPVRMPDPVRVPAAAAASSDQPFVRPTRRKREILEISAQFERCRADVPGFAQRSEALYLAWTRRHFSVLSEHEKLLALKVRAGRRGEATLPVGICTDEWLAAIEPLTHPPDARFQSVEKTWQVFLGALMTGDRDTALSCLAGNAHMRWKERTAHLSDDDLRRMGASVRALKVQWGDDYEKEGVVADTDNRMVGIAFRNVNEEWKITEMGGAPPGPLPTN